MYSRKCGYCGANLDPGEHCDCKGQKIADGRAVMGADLARGEDRSVAINRKTGERQCGNF